MYRPVGVFETEPMVSLISVQSNPKEQSIWWSSLAKYVKKNKYSLSTEYYFSWWHMNDLK